jgi:hypothetical protein
MKSMMSPRSRDRTMASPALAARIAPELDERAQVNGATEMNLFQAEFLSRDKTDSMLREADAHRLVARAQQHSDRAPKLAALQGRLRRPRFGGVLRSRRPAPPIRPPATR